MTISLETLPCCQRGPEIEAGRYACAHPDFYGRGATAEMCAVCTGRGQKCGQPRQPRLAQGDVQLVDCPSCAGNVRIKLHPGMSADAALRLLGEDKSAWPSGWWDWPGVQDAYATRADRLLAELPAYPAGRYSGRGVVIAGGGKYFPSVYVTVRALRHVGCDLPIQVWYLGSAGEMPAEWQRLLWPWGVESVDACAVAREHPSRLLQPGYQIKPYAVLHAPFQEVLFLDADCYPCRNPELLWDCPGYRQSGLVAWPDLSHTRAWTHWGAFRIQSDCHPPHESGQYLVDKARWWDALSLGYFWNEHSDFAYQHGGLGEKEFLHLAASKLHRDYAMYRFLPHFVWPAFVHDGPDLQPLFVHRVNDKFKFRCSQFYSAQQFEEARPNPALPLDAECFAWLDELKTLLGRA